MSSAIYTNKEGHIVLTTMTNPKLRVDYIQHAGKSVQLLDMERTKFESEFKLAKTKHTPVVVAQKYLGLAKSGVVITPGATFALNQIINNTTEGGPMALPTTLPKRTVKAAPVAKDAPKKLSELEVPAAEAEAPAKVKRTKAAPVAEAASEKPAKAPRKPRAEKAPFVSDSTLIADAQAQAEAIIKEADEKLEAAKLKAEENKANSAAKLEAKKIIEKAKAHAAKVKAQIAKLNGRGSKATEDGEEKPARTPRAAKADAEADDITGKKIVQLAEPNVREGSARGALALAVYKSKTVKSALGYEGVTVGLINKMVANGFIELA
jgi:hypothetical protein